MSLGSALIGVPTTQASMVGSVSKNLSDIGEDFILPEMLVEGLDLPNEGDPKTMFLLKQQHAFEGAMCKGDVANDWMGHLISTIVWGFACTNS